MLVAKHYRDSGYNVVEHGALFGHGDKGIDLIASKNGKTIFVQCKCWTGSIKVEHKEVKIFHSDSVLYEIETGVKPDSLRIFVPHQSSVKRSATHEIKRMNNVGIDIRYTVLAYFP